MEDLVRDLIILRALHAAMFVLIEEKHGKTPSNEEFQKEHEILSSAYKSLKLSLDSLEFKIHCDNQSKMLQEVQDGQQ